VSALLDRWGGIDVLVNNAGWSVPGFLAEDTDRAKWQRLVEVNFYTAIACTQAAIPPMREAGAGAIVFIASDAAFGQLRQGICGATKAALIALARTAAREHGPPAMAPPCPDPPPRPHRQSHPAAPISRPISRPPSGPSHNVGRPIAAFLAAFTYALLFLLTFTCAVSKLVLHFARPITRSSILCSKRLSASMAGGER
jgi:hypothetical protein